MSDETSNKLPRYENCFVCGRNNPAGLDLEFQRRGDLVFAKWIPEEKHLGYRDRVHGGVVAAILDEAMGWAPSHETGRLCYSAEISVRYRKPVPAGSDLRVEARMVENRRRLVRSRGRLVGDDGVVYATATGTYVPLSPDETDSVLGYLYLEGDEERPITTMDL